MTKDEALKLALEGFERSVATCFDQYAHQQVMSQPDHFINQTITAIKEVLAQPPEEPVAWMHHDGARVTTAADRKNYPDYETRYSVPLYTTPPQREWVGLTDEEIDTWNIVGHESLREFVRAIEAKLKEKNT